MNGERLQIARESCWLTQVELSKLSGVSASTISKVEKGLYGSNADSFAEPLASAMDLPVSFLLGNSVPDVPDGRFRRQSKASSKLKKSVVSHAKQLTIVMNEADGAYRIHKTTLKALEPGELDGSTEAHAAKLRGMLGLGQEGPVGNMTRACERAGIAVVNLPLFESTAENERHFSGFSVWPDMGLGGSRPLVVLSSALPGDVQRSTLAHEAAHLYAHTRNPSIDVGVAEKQAWDIGANVLVPAAELRDAFDDQAVTLDRLRRLKAKYGVSVKFLITHCRHEGIIGDEKDTSLHKQYSSRKWNQSEPVKVERENATLFPAVLRRMRKDGLDIGLRQLEIASIMAEDMPGTAIAKEKQQVIRFARKGP